VQVGSTEAPNSASVYEALFAEFAQPGQKCVVLEDVAMLKDRLLSAQDTQLLANFKFPSNPKKHRANSFGTVPVRLLANKEYVELFSDAKSCSGGWRAFHERYPTAKALAELSHVAFRSNGKGAVVLLTLSSACLGGTSDLLFFERFGPAWKFTNSINVGRA
jgi:hypothetical protein